MPPANLPAATTMNHVLPAPFLWSMVGGRPRNVLRSRRDEGSGDAAPPADPPSPKTPAAPSPDPRRPATALDVRAILDAELKGPFDPRFCEAMEEVACAAVGEPLEHARLLVRSLAAAVLSGGSAVPEGALRNIRLVAKALKAAPGYRSALTVETFRSAASIILRAYRGRA